MKELYIYNYTWAHDNELWLRLVFDVPSDNEVVFRTFKKPVCGYRRSHDSMNKKNRQNQGFRDFQFQRRVRYLKKILPDIDSLGIEIDQRFNEDMACLQNLEINSKCDIVKPEDTLKVL